jgi:hypothetical protein
MLTPLEFVQRIQCVVGPLSTQFNDIKLVMIKSHLDGVLSNPESPQSKELAQSIMSEFIEGMKKPSIQNKLLSRNIRVFEELPHFNFIDIVKRLDDATVNQLFDFLIDLANECEIEQIDIAKLPVKEQVNAGVPLGSAIFQNPENLNRMMTALNKVGEHIDLNNMECAALDFFQSGNPMKSNLMQTIKKCVGETMVEQGADPKEIERELNEMDSMTKDQMMSALGSVNMK